MEIQGHLVCLNSCIRMNSMYMCCFSMLPDCYGLRPGREAWDSEKIQRELDRQTEPRSNKVRQ